MGVLKGAVLVLVLCAACVESDSVPCGGGLYCPSGKRCAAVTDPDESLCVPEAQVAACKDAPRYQPCATADIPSGRCYDGVCLATGCGNGRLDLPDPNTPMDLGEVCDDGNQISGDDCSADCLSIETCGNGIVDSVKSEGCDDGNFIDNDGCNSVCEPEEATWIGRTESDPINDGHREGHAMAYDIARNQVVLFGGIGREGGKGASADLNDTWVWDGRGWMQIKTSVAPSGRYGHAMVYDSKRQRVVLFGGFSSAGNTALGDTWEWDGTRWMARTSNAAPTARANHSMTYDAKRGVVVLYGGDINLGGSFVSPTNQYSDTWLWDGTAWSPQVTATAPTCTGGALDAANGRHGAALAFDPVRGVSVLFGGGCYYINLQFQAFAYLGDTAVWELDATGWTAKSPSSGPTAREGAVMAFSPASKRVLMFGGTTPPEQWEWNGVAWTPSAATLPPFPSPTLATDSERGRIVMFGGDPTTDAQETHEWDGATWSAPLTTVVPDYGSTLATFDTRRGRAILVTSFGAVLERSETGWVDGTDAGPFPMLTTAYPREVVYDAARGYTVVLATDSSDFEVSQTWIWNGSTWSQVAGTQPPSRTGGGLSFDAKRNLVVLFGGRSATAALADTWTFDGTTWTHVMPATSPPARDLHVFAYDPIRDVSVLVGGRSADGFVLGDVWTWNGTAWTAITASGGPQPRYASSLTWQPKRGRLALVGGYGAGGVGLADVWEWIGSGLVQLAVPATILGRGDAILVPTHDGGGLVLQGGLVRAPVYGLIQRTLSDDAELRWQGQGTGDSCTDALDLDGDKLAGCADPDCAPICSPLGASGPRCGDQACAPGLEDCRSCPGDCGACTATCSDSYCDPGETGAQCPGDC